MRSAVLGGFCATVFLSCGIGDAAAQTADPLAAIPEVLRVWVTPGTQVEDFVSARLDALRHWDKDGDGLSEDDLDLQEKLAASVSRAARVARIVEFDADGDGKVRREEIVAKLMPPWASSLYQESVNHNVETIMTADVNGDGVIDYDEMRADRDAKLRGDRKKSKESDQARALLALDPNGDGRLEPGELRPILLGVFAAIDTNGDARIDESEGASYEAARLAAKAVADARAREAAVEKCDLPKPNPGDVVIAVGAGAGAGLANVSVAGLDEVTSTLSLEIEPGTAKIYLVLSSGEPIIWRLEGAVDRLSEVVHLSNWQYRAGAAGGTTGVPAARVFFSTQRECRPIFSQAASIEGVMQRARLKQGIGRDADQIVVTDKAASIEIPSGVVDRGAGAQPAPAGLDRRLWAEALEIWPDGLVKLDPATVVSQGPVQTYPILPGMMGMAQLVGDGTLVPIENPRGFRIAKAIVHVPVRFWNIALRYKLVLGAGVPMPSGSRRLACIALEGTREALDPRVTCSNLSAPATK